MVGSGSLAVTFSLHAVQSICSTLEVSKMYFIKVIVEFVAAICLLHSMCNDLPVKSDCGIDYDLIVKLICSVRKIQSIRMNSNDAQSLDTPGMRFVNRKWISRIETINSHKWNIRIFAMISEICVSIIGSFRIVLRWALPAYTQALRFSFFSIYRS